MEDSLKQNVAGYLSWGHWQCIFLSCFFLFFWEGEDVAGLGAVGLVGWLGSWLVGWGVTTVTVGGDRFRFADEAKAFLSLVEMQTERLGPK